jgi:hypothetical protein
MYLRVYLSHLMGLFYRTIRIAENGIKPAYVFDGKPPDLKAGIVRLNLSSLTPCGDLWHDGCSLQNDLKDAKTRKPMGKRLRRQVGWTEFALCPEAHSASSI